MVKEELNSEEQFFEKAVMTERFVKKYKKPLIGAVAAIVIIAGGSFVYDLNKQNTIDAANATLAKLQTGGADAAKLERLASLSPELHDLWVYAQAMTNKSVVDLQSVENSSAPVIGDMASYEVASRTDDKKLLENYAKRENAIYKDLALVELAIVSINEGNAEESHNVLSMISDQSPLASVAKALMHYGVK